MQNEYEGGLNIKENRMCFYSEDNISQQIFVVENEGFC